MLYKYEEEEPKIGKEVFIAPDASIIGKVEIGDYSSIWFQCVLRGDVEPIVIGKECNIQDGVIIHGVRGKYSTYIGNRVSIGHRAIIHGATILDDVLIGMGAIILDGAKISSYSFIAAGAVVPPQMEIPPESLVMGVPAKIKRKISPQEKEIIERTAKNYQEYAKNMKKSLPR